MSLWRMHFRRSNRIWLIRDVADWRYEKPHKHFLKKRDGRDETRGVIHPTRLVSRGNAYGNQAAENHYRRRRNEKTDERP